MSAEISTSPSTPAITHFILDEGSKGGVASMASGYNRSDKSLVEAIKTRYPHAHIETIHHNHDNLEAALQAIEHSFEHDKINAVFLGFSAEDKHTKLASAANEAGLTTLILHNQHYPLDREVANLRDELRGGEDAVFLTNGYTGKPDAILDHLEKLHTKVQTHETPAAIVGNGAVAGKVHAQKLDGRTL